MLDADGTARMLLHVAARIIESKQLLTDADKMGDGDHGVGMARGFKAVVEKLRTTAFSEPADVFKATGLAIMSSAGGASGAVFGTFFQRGGAEIAGSATLDADSFHLFLKAGLEGVQKRGKAKPGDKTMVDALAPAVDATREVTDLHGALFTAAKAARPGMEATKQFPAKIGKMKSLGERTIGYPDPGAITLTLILEAMRDFAGG